MIKVTFWKTLAVLLSIAMLAAACGGAATTAPQPTSETKPTGASPSTGSFVSKLSDKTTSSGFTCPEPQPRMQLTSKELNLYVWTEYIPPDHIDCFQAVYGVTVNREEYSANEEMYAKLNAGASNYDLVQPTDYMVPLMVRQGLLQKLDKSKLPILPYFDSNYINLSFDPNNEYTVPYQAGTDAIVVNTDVVSQPPKSFADLWSPELITAKRMIMLDDSRAIIGAALLTLGYDINTTDPEQLKQAEVKLTELSKGVKIYNSDAVRANLLAGDVDLGITWTGEAFLAQQENPAIQYFYPTEGAVLWQDNYAIPKDAPHLDAAYAWINYTMQPDLFWLMLRDFPYTNPNKGTLDYAKSDSATQVDDGVGGTITPAELYQAYIDSPITNTPPEELKKGHRVTDVGEATPLYDEIWTRIKK